MKTELAECSETSAQKIHTMGNHQKERTQREFGSKKIKDGI